MEALKKKSSVSRDLTFDNIHDITLDDPVETSLRVPVQSRSSIKSFITKKFQPLAASAATDTNTATSTQNEVKQKKRRTSFRQFSQFLKRSHSAHTDLSTIGMTHNGSPSSADDLSQKQLNEEFDRTEISRSNTTTLPTSNGSTLRPISEEEHSIPAHQRLTSADDEPVTAHSKSTCVCCMIDCVSWAERGSRTV